MSSQPITGQTTVTPQQIADRVARRWHVDVHTAGHPSGEIGDCLLDVGQ